MVEAAAQHEVAGQGIFESETRAQRVVLPRDALEVGATVAGGGGRGQVAQEGVAQLRRQPARDRSGEPAIVVSSNSVAPRSRSVVRGDIAQARTASTTGARRSPRR